jgi:hypothetical protein
MTKRGRGGAAERGEGVRRLELLQNLLLLKLRLLFSLPLPTRSRQHRGGTPRLSDRVAGLARRVKGETAENVLLFQAPVRTPSDALTCPHTSTPPHTLQTHYRWRPRGRAGREDGVNPAPPARRALAHTVGKPKGGKLQDDQGSALGRGDTCTHILTATLFSPLVSRLAGEGLRVHI